MVYYSLQLSEISEPKEECKDTCNAQLQTTHKWQKPFLSF